MRVVRGRLLSFIVFAVLSTRAGGVELEWNSEPGPDSECMVIHPSSGRPAVCSIESAGNPGTEDPQ
jgi:hypothetical protein